MKHKLVKRVVALALSFTLALALFAPITVSAGNEVVFDIQSFAGMSLTGDSQFVEGNGIQRMTWNRFVGTTIAVVGNTLEVRIGADQGGVQLGEHERHIQGFQGTTGVEYSVVMEIAAISEDGMLRMRADSHAADGTELDLELTTERETFVMQWVQEAHQHNNVQISADVDFRIYTWRVYEVVENGDEEPEDEEPEDEEPEDEEPEDEEPEDEEPEDEEPYVPADPIVEPDPIDEVIEDIVIVLTMGSTIATVNGIQFTLPAAPFVEGGRTMVPARFVSDHVPGAHVRWSRPYAILTHPGGVVYLAEGVEHTPGLGATMMRDGSTFVPFRLIGETILGGRASHASGVVTLTFVGAGGPVQQPPVQQPPVEAPGDDNGGAPGDVAAPAGENSLGILVTNAEPVGVQVVVGIGQDTFPFASGTEDGSRAFAPVPGDTYRITFNVTNQGSGGWRVRWTNAAQLFGAFTSADADVVNDFEFSPGQVANAVPAHFNQGVSAFGTYNLAVDVVFDPAQGFNGLIGNVILAGTAGSHDFVVNWVTVEKGGEIIAQYVA